MRQGDRRPETHTKRQATQHGCLPSLLDEPTKKRFLSFVLFESPFASVSTVSRGHPSIVSLPETEDRRLDEKN
jgi:hypothetical protein